MQDKILIYWVSETGCLPREPVAARLACWIEAQPHLEILASDTCAGRNDGGVRPDLLLIETSRRGVISGSRLNELREQFPLTLVMEITGAWCRGDTRSGQPLPIPLRVEEFAGERRLRRILASGEHYHKFRECATPMTSGRDLIQLWDEIPVDACSGKVIHVVGQDKQERLAISDSLRARGLDANAYSVTEWNRSPRRDGLVVQCIVNRGELKDVIWGAETAPDILIAPHLNRADRDAVAVKGCKRILSKPFLTVDLVLLLAHGGRSTSIAAA